MIFCQFDKHRFSFDAVFFKTLILSTALVTLFGCAGFIDGTESSRSQTLGLNSEELAKRDKLLEGKTRRPSLKSLDLQPLVKQALDVPYLSLEEKKVQYEKLLPLIKDPVQKQQVAFRLADIKMLLAEEQLQTTDGSTQQNQSLELEKAKLSDAIKEYEQAIANFKLYRAVDSVPISAEQAALNRKHMDAMYQLVRALDLNAQPDQSLKIAQQFITVFDEKTFGTTAYHIELYFRIGEYYFNRQRYSDAAIFYNKVVSYATSNQQVGLEATNFYVISAYMLGWSEFKLDKYQDAMESFTIMLDTSLSTSSSIAQLDLLSTTVDQLPFSNGELRLIKDAVRVMALTFSYQGNAKAIAAFFESVGGRNFDHLIYSELAQQYLDESRYQDSARVLSFYAQNQPAHPRAVEFFIRHIDAYVLGQFPDKILQGKELFVKTYSLSSNLQGGIDTPLGRQAAPYLKQFLKELAQTEHSLAQRLHRLAVEADPSRVLEKDYKPGFSQGDLSDGSDILKVTSATQLSELSRQAYTRAVDYYATFIDTFVFHESTPRLRFYMAEGLFALGRFQEAIDAFETYAFNDESTGEPEPKEAAYAALLAYDNLLDQQQEIDKGVGQANQLTRHDIVKHSYRKSQAIFINRFGEDSRAPLVTLNLMQDLFNNEHYLAAQEWAFWLLANSQVFQIDPNNVLTSLSSLEGVQNEILRNELKNQSASITNALLPHTIDIQKQESAMLVLAHSEFAQTKFAVAELAYRQLSKYYQRRIESSNNADKAQYADKLFEIDDLLAASIYKQAERLLVSNTLDTDSLVKQKITSTEQLSVRQIEIIETGLELLLKVVTETPNSEFRLAAQFDAAVYYTLLGQWQNSIDTFIAFKQRYPSHELSKGIDNRLFVAYEKLEDWPKAAAILLKTYQNAPTSEQGRLALYQAAQYFEKADQLEQAKIHFRKYAHAYPEPFTDANEARFWLSEHYRTNNEDRKRRFWLNKMIQTQLELMRERPDSITARSTYLASMSSMVFAKDADAAFTKIKLIEPVEESLERKQKALTLAIEKYEQVIQLGSQDYVTDANHQLAKLYQVLASDLMDSQRPAGLTPLEMAQYEILLEEQAYPFEETAITLYEQNASRTSDGIYDQWVKASFDALKKIMPARYDKPEQLPEITIDDF